MRSLQETLQRAVGGRVQIHPRKSGGSLELHYATLEELDRLVERLVR